MTRATLPIAHDAATGIHPSSVVPGGDSHAGLQGASLTPELMMQAVALSGAAVWHLDLATDIFSASAELFRMLGMAPQPHGIAAQHIRALQHPEDRAQAVALMQAILSSGRPLESQLRYLLADGRCLHLLSRRSLLRNSAGQPQAVLGVTLDMTDRHAQEQRALTTARELREERERTALAVAGAGIGTWEWRSKSQLARWDDNMFHLRGLAPHAAALSNEERMALVHPADRAAVDEAMTQAIQQRVPLHYEFRIVRPDGEVRWIASRSVDMPDPETCELRRIGANWDVTDRRAAEQARRDMDLAQRESQAKSRFMARMSHELRTPLNAVLGFTQLLLAEGPGQGDASSRKHSLQHIQHAGQHLLELINDVLDIARVEGGEMTLSRAPVSLAALVQHTLPLMLPLAEAAQVRIGTGELALAVLGDEVRLRQVLLNLLSNGIKYNRAGGEVFIDAAARGALVHLRVRDSGRGVAAARLSELFEPFNRLGAEREGIEGTGIGLAIVKSLVEHMGGHVQVSSTLGEGSLFEVLLPCADAAATLEEPAAIGRPATRAAPAASAASLASLASAASRAPAASAASDVSPASGNCASQALVASPASARPSEGAASGPLRRVLYIEDNAVNALILRELLATVPGYELTIAPDGASGIAQAQCPDVRPELVLLDMQLPDMDGFDVLRRLREKPHTAAVPVVALSANAMPEQVSRGIAAGLVDYWTKPLDMPLFLQRLAALLPPHPR